MPAAVDTYVDCEAIADARRVGRMLRGLGVARRIVAHPRARTGWDSLTDSDYERITGGPAPSSCACDYRAERI